MDVIEKVKKQAILMAARDSINWKNMYYPRKSGVLADTTVVSPGDDGITISMTRYYGMILDKKKGVKWTNVNTKEQFYRKHAEYTTKRLNDFFELLKHQIPEKLVIKA